jgi:hypothetical protein
MSITMNFDSFGSHDVTFSFLEDMRKVGVFDDLPEPESFTSSMIHAIRALHIKDFSLLAFCINSMSSFTTERMTGKQRIDFIKTYCQKHTPQHTSSLLKIIHKHNKAKT